MTNKNKFIGTIYHDSAYMNNSDKDKKYISKKDFLAMTYVPVKVKKSWFEYFFGKR